MAVGTALVSGASMVAFVVGFAQANGDATLTPSPHVTQKGRRPQRKAKSG